VVRQIKENCCFVAFNPEAEESTRALQKTQYQLPDGTNIEVCLRAVAVHIYCYAIMLLCSDTAAYIFCYHEALLATLPNCFMLCDVCTDWP
jgi:hypothetical protein